MLRVAFAPSSGRALADRRRSRLHKRMLDSEGYRGPCRTFTAPMGAGALLRRLT